MDKQTKMVTFDEFLNSDEIGLRTISPTGQTFESIAPGITLVNGKTYCGRSSAPACDWTGLLAAKRRGRA